MNLPQTLVLPRLAESLTQAKVVSWLVSEGEVVLPGRPVVEVDADKFVVELEVEQPCLIERILEDAGATVAVGGALARLGPVPPVPPAASAIAAAVASAAAPESTHALTDRSAASDDGRPQSSRARPALSICDAAHGFQLEPRTAAGRRFCALAEEHAAAVAARAEADDREGRFPEESFAEMRESGFAAACVPESLGGGGLRSLHDLAVGIGRLARADASTAIAMNMHLSAVWTLARHWRFSPDLAYRYESPLRDVAEGRVLHCVAGTETGTDVLHPLTEARRDGRGWRVTGRKLFCTLSGGADLFHVTVRVPDADGGGYTVCIATIPRDAPGLVIHGDWDGLGMRASASHTIELRDCVVTDAQLMRQARWGELSPMVLEAQVAGNIGLLGAFLGTAEAARALVLPSLRTRRKAPAGQPLSQRPGIQHGVGELEISLAAMRAMLGRVGMLADSLLDGCAPGAMGLATAHQLMREFQCAKWLINRKAIEVVDQAMTLSGGSGYRSRDPLARLYRDVRAGPFMQLFSPNEAFDYIGQVALGLEPDLG